MHENGLFRDYRPTFWDDMHGSSSGAREICLMKKEMKIFGYFGRIATFAEEGKQIRN